MGARGPSKKPAELEALHGNPGHRKAPKQIKFEKSEKAPTPPPFLDKVAKKEWKRLAPIVYKAGLLTEADIGAFAAYCHSYSQWVMADKAIQARKDSDNALPPLTFVTDKGYSMQIPEINIVNSAKKQMLTFAREFGLTPSSRSGMASPLETEDKKASIMEFISKKNMENVR